MGDRVLKRFVILFVIIYFNLNPSQPLLGGIVCVFIRFSNERRLDTSEARLEGHPPP